MYKECSMIGRLAVSYNCQLRKYKYNIENIDVWGNNLYLCETVDMSNVELNELMTVNTLKAN